MYIVTYSWCLFDGIRSKLQFAYTNFRRCYYNLCVVSKGIGNGVREVSMAFIKGSTFTLGMGMCLIAVIQACFDGRLGYAVPLVLFGSLVWTGALFLPTNNQSTNNYQDNSK